jgi:hypothetical protein
MIVYIDMDGVVADFDRHFLDMYSVPMNELSNKNKSLFWDDWCERDKFFRSSPPIEEGLLMLEEIDLMGVNWSFLTSTGGKKRHTEIGIQKLEWLKKHWGDPCEFALATGTLGKAKHAHLDAFLIDDRQKVVDAFRKDGWAHLFERDKWEDAVGWVKDYAHHYAGQK